MNDLYEESMTDQMGLSCTVAEGRRTERLELSVPVLVTSVRPERRIWCHGETVDVSANGARFRLSEDIPVGTTIRLDLLHSDQILEARVVRSEPEGKKRWLVAINLTVQAGNVWGLKDPPRDWSLGWMWFD